MAGYPRVTLSGWPTPLEECPRLSAALGGPHLWVKRDDLTHVGLGGNKIRKLEFLLGEAVRKGCDTVITTGALQSNHASLTAASCRKLGLEVILVLEPGVDAHGEPVDPCRLPPLQGNHLLDHLFGAEVVIMDKGAGADATDARMDEIASSLSARGRHPYVIPRGGTNPVGCLGYVAGSLEIASQAFAEGVSFDHVFVTTGSGGTHAGLHLGLSIHMPGAVVHGVTVLREASASAARVDELVGATQAHMGLRSPEAGFRPSSALVHGGFVGDGYGIPTEAGWEALELVARTEGLVLDPVYTGKTMSGLIGLIRQGAFEPSETVLFVHTGGSSGLMAKAGAYEERLSGAEGDSL